MRALVAFLVFAAVTPAVAQILDAARPPRAVRPSVTRPADPAVIRQGGGSWEEAVPIAGLPFATTGTNVGYTENCCLDMCPYEAWGPSVYYSFTPTQAVAVRVDLCGSDYDTGLYVFDEHHSVVECNVDFYFGPPCGMYVSCIERAELAAGELYYVVVTGMGGHSGNYVLEMTEWQDCVIDVPAGAVPEGEPPLVDGYHDAHNGGCNSPEFGLPFQALFGDSQGHLLFAGVSGWYVEGYMSYRDTDWFTLILGEAGVLDVTLLAENDTYLFEAAPQDCNAVEVAQQANAEDCNETAMQVTGEPGAVVWLVVVPTTFSAPGYPPGNEFDYVLTIDGLQPGPVVLERTTWSTVRVLFR